MLKNVFFTAMVVLSSTSAFADCANPVTTVERGYCLDLEFKEEERKLNDAYDRFKKHAEKYFIIYSPYSKTNENAVLPALEEAQDAWLEYREQNCKYYDSTYYPGTEAGVAYIRCKKRMTIVRTKELEKEYQFWSSK
ncbi:MAG: DUF1311 domain-containing protein [Gammaproteobacteria bacterium]|nr:DUF1311 domain-containing protein [Gammaproteobacteria bacterium]MDH5650648.1 DUF1311 domain-containing protein [Gammaproteobacteria bacterium]